MKVFFIITLLVAGSLGINAQNQNTSRLTGTIFDQNGAVVVGAKVTAKVNGKVFETVSNGEGFYLIELPFIPYKPGIKPAKFDVLVKSQGFLTSTIKGYLFVPSCTSRMSLDIALEASGISISGMATR